MSVMSIVVSDCGSEDAPVSDSTSCWVETVGLVADTDEDTNNSRIINTKMTKLKIRGVWDRGFTNSSFR